MNYSLEFLVTQIIYIILAMINMLIKISVVNPLHRGHPVLDGLEVKLYLLKKPFLYTYIFILAKPSLLTEMAELPELLNREKLDRG